MKLVTIGRRVLRMAVLAAFSLVSLPVQAQISTPVLVRVAPAMAQVAPGETAEVAVEVVDVQDLYGFDLTITFDPRVVEVVDVDPQLPGVQVAQGLFMDPGFAVINAADNAVGNVHFVMTQLNPSLPKTGTGSLIIVKLLGKQVGASSPLTLANPQLARRDGFMIPAKGGSGQVDVILGGGPTNTSMPVQGAGTPMATVPPEPATPVSTATREPTSRPATVTPPPAAPVATATREPTSRPATVTPASAAPVATATQGPNNRPTTVTVAAGSPTRTSTVPPATPAAALPSHTPVPDARLVASVTAVGTPEAAILPPAATPLLGASPPPLLTVPAGASGTAETTAILGVLAVPGAGGAVQESGDSRSACIALWGAGLAGAMAIAIGAAALVVWLRRRRSTGA